MVGKLSHSSTVQSGSNPASGHGDAKGLKPAAVLDKQVQMSLSIASVETKGMPLMATTQAGRTKKRTVKKTAAVGAGGTVVLRLIRGARTKGRASQLAPGRLVTLLREGLAVEEIDDLREALGISMARLTDLLAISKATLQRRRAGQVLGRDESDRVVRYARLMGRAVEVCESEEAARQWLASPQVGLAGETPLEYARTEVGAREVEDLLGRIDHGVYS
ncbi:MAG: hypothetical protein PWP23_1729 [Candidatus Sumerlaeota bacterium]|nr:hypothetical protein [Candidatus Sumerlaeota bacterium]